MRLKQGLLAFEMPKAWGNKTGFNIMIVNFSQKTGNAWTLKLMSQPIKIDKSPQGY